MKLLITGDWHLDTQRPENRIDDYQETQFDKIKWIYKLAQKTMCDAILQPGDMFNSHKANDFIKQRYINFMRELTRPRDGIVQPPHLYTIYGQHDLRYHSSDRENTPLAVLEAADVCHICGEDPFSTDMEKYRVYIYGMNWGENIPPVRNEPGVHILLMHKLVVEQTIGWEKDFLSADNVFRFSDHDIIVCGDNHQSFIREECDKIGPVRLLFNCGSLMRNKLDQKDHRPVVYIVDVCDLQYEKYYVPIREFHEVMDVSNAERKKERNEELESFVDKLGGEVDISGLDFKHNVMSYCKENDIDRETIAFIEEVMS